MSLPETAYQIVHDEAMLDGNARLNLPPSSPPGWMTGPSAVRRDVRQEHDRQG